MGYGSDEGGRHAASPPCALAYAPPRRIIFARSHKADFQVKSDMVKMLKTKNKFLIAASGLVILGAIAGSLNRRASASPQKTSDGSAGTAAQEADAKEWPTYGHDSGGMRYSPLTQINTSNVNGLSVAWVYHMKPADYVPPAGRGRGPGGPGGPGGFGDPGGPGGPGGAGAPAGAGGRGGDPVAAQAAQEGVGGFGRGGTSFSTAEDTPLVVNGVMYIATPYGRVTALDPTTGKEIWTYKLPTGDPATRGVEYFPGDKKIPPQIVVGTSDAKLFTLDAETGTLNTAFGANGVVDLNTPEITHNLPNSSDGLSSPPVMFENLVIVGGRTTENGGPGPAGDVRAFDIHDGKLVSDVPFDSAARRAELRRLGGR